VADITELSRQSVRFLLSHEVKALVVACNTICVSCLDILRSEFRLPFVGVIDAGAAEAVRVARKTVGLIGTRVTVQSGAHRRAVESLNENLVFCAEPAPLFAPIIEEGFAEHEMAYVAAVEYTKNLVAQDIDTLILGCTHIPLMRRNIQRAVGPGVRLVDPSRGAAMELRALLEGCGMCREDTRPPCINSISAETRAVSTRLPRRRWEATINPNGWISNAIERKKRILCKSCRFGGFFCTGGCGWGGGMIV
jgi:glutamate racemase